MGDFYELFSGRRCVAALNIVLTKRGKHQGADIPMCGVPVVRADEYLHADRGGVSRRRASRPRTAEAKKRGARAWCSAT